MLDHMRFFLCIKKLSMMFLAILSGYLGWKDINRNSMKKLGNLVGKW